MRIGKSFEATVYVFMHVFIRTCGTHDCGYVSVCDRVQMWFIHTSPTQCKFPTTRSVGRAFPVCCVRCCQCLSLVCQIQLRSSHSSLIMTWHAKRVGWWWGGEKGERRGGFYSLQQALFSPRSPGHHTPAGTHLIMHTAWRRGQHGTQK